MPRQRALLLSGALVLACASARGADEETAQQSAAIVGPGDTPGKIDEGDAFTGVVRVDFPIPSQPGLVFACTGTLLSCREVLTAQHCLDSFTKEVQVGLLRYTGTPTPKFTVVTVPVQLGATVVPQ